MARCPLGHGLLRNFPNVGLMALGLTDIYCLFLVAPLVHSGHSAVYHWHGSALDLFLPVFLDVVVTWIVTVVLLLFALPTGKARIAVWSGILLFTPPIISNSWDHVWGMPSSSVTWVLFVSALIGCVLLMWRWRPTFSSQLDRIVEIASAGLRYIGVGGALLLCQLAWLGWQARSLNDRSRMHHSVKVAAGSEHPRIFWVVFDELSYQQVYERRYEGLQLPAFDALAADSTVFTHVVPAGIFTDRVLPSLLSGKPVDTVRSSPGGHLLIHSPDTRRWQPFDEHETVFQDALDAGYGTAVVGWYIPYCRILSDVLDQCFWSYDTGIKNGMNSNETLHKNMLQPLAYLIRGGALDRLLGRFLPGAEPAIHDAQLHIDDYQSLSAASDQVLIDRSASFVLLHLPIPHLGGIYNRMSGQLTTGPSTYLDNLVLADKYLAHLRILLEQSGQWDSSAIIVMGDHSWRTAQMWKGSSVWTTEEEKASHGGEFDDRPFYTVKLPGQKSGSHIDSPYAALTTRALLDAILRKKITSSQELSAWVEQNPVTPIDIALRTTIRP